MVGERVVDCDDLIVMKLNYFLRCAAGDAGYKAAVISTSRSMSWLWGGLWRSVCFDGPARPGLLESPPSLFPQRRDSERHHKFLDAGGAPAARRGWREGRQIVDCR